MNSTARNDILNKLKEGRGSVDAFPPKVDLWKAPLLSEEEKKERVCSQLEKVFATVVRTKEQDLSTTLSNVILQHGIKKIAYGLGVWSTSIIETLDTEHIPFTASIEEYKNSLFHDVDAGITTTKGAIAENGAILLHPSPEEPRTLSLIPPIHIALVRAKDIFSSLTEVIEKQQWNTVRPTNILLIASPSRTADIELVLAVGVHGPKQLIVVVIE